MSSTARSKTALVVSSRCADAQHGAVLSGRLTL
jgi:hypothetical protein